MTTPRDVLSETYDAVLFDMDGTMLDSTAAVVRSWTRWAAEFDVPLRALAELNTHGRPARDIVADVLPSASQTGVDAACARIEELEIVDTDGCVPLPGAVAALTTAGPRAAIVTSCSRALAEARLAAAGLPRPPVVVTVDDVRHGKPDPEPFLLAARQLGADPRRCLVAEDAPAGLAAAAAAGSARLAVTSTHTADELSADLVVPGLAAIALVAENGGVAVRAAGSIVESAGLGRDRSRPT